MSVLEGKRREVRHVIKDASEHWIGRLSNTVVEIPAPRSKDGFPASPDSDGVRRVALGNEERLPDKFKTNA